MLSKDFREFIQSLNANDVRYLVVGGYAVAIHGHPRYTKGIDIWIWLAQGNAERMLQTLEDFGLGSLGIQEEDLITHEQHIQ